MIKDMSKFKEIKPGEPIDLGITPQKSIQPDHVPYEIVSDGITVERGILCRVDNPYYHDIPGARVFLSPKRKEKNEENQI